jgi:signal transduction histidine kinase
VRTSSDGGDILLEVSDDGCGIPKEHLPSVFDPGFTTKGVKVGIGVGLAICFQIVAAHRGTIRVNSTMDVGTTFTVLLPAFQTA